MGETNVAIGESELNLIGEYVQSHLPGWMERLGIRAQPDPVTNTQLLERVVRVEEELKAGREVMVARFEASDRRFESIDLRIGDLTKTMDDRFTDLIETMNNGFAGVKGNLSTVKWFVVTSFLVLGAGISLLAVFL